jgi:3-hydroxyacyl-[acyl-carrier-protein] dehydratase
VQLVAVKPKNTEGIPMTQDLKRADIQTIQRILPHRYPFLLVDKVEEIDGTTSSVGYKNVTMNEPHFQGHFPGTPIMPGVTIVEAMAQTAGVMIGVALDQLDRDMLIYFMSIDNCKFRRKVVPGDVLRMDVKTLRGKPGGKIWKFSGVATVDGEMAASAEFMAMLDLPKEDA